MGVGVGSWAFVDCVDGDREDGGMGGLREGGMGGRRVEGYGGGYGGGRKEGGRREDGGKLRWVRVRYGGEGGTWEVGGKTSFRTLGFI